MRLTESELTQAKTAAHVSVAGKNVRYDELKELFKNLMQNPNLTSLDFSLNWDSFLLIKLKEFLQVRSNIQSLRLDDCRIFGSDVDELLELMLNQPSIKEVSLENNPLYLWDLGKLKKFSKEHPEIKLSFSSNKPPLEDYSTFDDLNCFNRQKP